MSPNLLFRAVGVFVICIARNAFKISSSHQIPEIRFTQRLKSIAVSDNSVDVGVQSIIFGRPAFAENVEVRDVGRISLRNRNDFIVAVRGLGESEFPVDTATGTREMDTAYPTSKQWGILPDEPSLRSLRSAHECDAMTGLEPKVNHYPRTLTAYNGLSIQEGGISGTFLQWITEKLYPEMIFWIFRRLCTSPRLRKSDHSVHPSDPNIARGLSRTGVSAPHLPRHPLWRLLDTLFTIPWLKFDCA